MTNVMGFARIALIPGTWEVENFRSAPSKLEVGPLQTGFVLRMFVLDAGTIDGIVVDDQSRPVPNADVAIAESTEAKWNRSNAHKDNPHWPPEGDSRAETDEHGKFTMRTFDVALPLIATKDTRTSKLTVATVGAEGTQLRLFTPAFARFSSSCRGLFIQYDYLGDTIELAAENGAEQTVASGLRIFRARCLQRGRLMTGSVEIEIKPGDHQGVAFELKRSQGLKVKLLDPRGAVLPGVTVHARLVGADSPNSDAVATTNNAGNAVLVPGQLGSYDPLYRLELTGAWRAQKEVFARLGDVPMQLVAVPSSGR